MPQPEIPPQLGPIFTLGKLFPDGSAIERLRDGQLVLRHDNEEVTSPSIHWNNQVYAAAPLDPKLEQHLRLPSGTADFGSTDDLVADLVMAISTKAGLDQQAALLVASYVVTTWVVDCLPSVVCLNPWGPHGTADGLLQLFSSLCRRSLRLANPGVRELASLPEDLCPTIVLREPGQRVLTQLLAAGEPNIVLFRARRWISLRCTIVACSQFPVTVPAVSIPLLPPTTQQRITRAEADQLAEEFQPRPLRYRLTQHTKVTNSQFDAPSFSPQPRCTARILGGALEGTPEVQARIVDALRSVDEQYKSEQSQGLDAVVLEALLALCHENRNSARVIEIADVANTILLGRHGRRDLSPKAVGGLLRQDLGLSVKRRGPGYELDLSNDTCDRVHRLAWSRSVLSTLQPKVDCLFCSGFSQASVAPSTSISSTTSTQVHKVHETETAGDQG